MNGIRLLSIAIALGLFFSCEEDGGRHLLSVEEDLLFTFVLDSTFGTGKKGEYLLVVRTAENWTCVNYLLECESIIESDLISIDIHGAVLDGGGCYTALGPARVAIPIDRKTGSFDLFIHSHSGLDKYDVSITDTVVVTPIHTSYTAYYRYDWGQSE